MEITRSFIHIICHFYYFIQPFVNKNAVISQKYYRKYQNSEIENIKQIYLKRNNINILEFSTRKNKNI